MQIEYDLTIDDYVRLAEHTAECSPTVQRVKHLSTLSGPIAFLLIGIAMSIRDGTPAPLMAFVFVSILWIVFYPRYWRSTYRRRLHKFLSEGLNTSFPEHCTTRI